ncbi:NADH-dependent flavin oxidoreductase [Gnomoniopsis sp. IMI 355080]|nr:NADH-dependent flavin oxidoreductase [Gnomoniopsis sp. IMI 355080]
MSQSSLLMQAGKPGTSNLCHSRLYNSILTGHSTLAPWHRQAPGTPHVATPDAGGWPDNVWGPSAISFSKTFPQVKEMTLDQIKETIEAFAQAAKRAVEAGFDVIEIHGAHGYLITQRTDEYGGSFENRIRFLIECVKAVRAVIPDSMPLFVRISATEWMEWSGKENWDMPQSIKLAHLLPELGVDLLDVSSGGNSSDQKLELHPYYQVDKAGEIRKSLQKSGKKMLIGALGAIDNAEMARDIVQNNSSFTDSSSNDGEDQSKADVVIIARQFLQFSHSDSKDADVTKREPEFCLRAAHHLGVQVKWPNQYMRADWPASQKV